MNNQVKGYACAAAAAVSYGLNPLCALFLYQDGLTAGSVLFYRFAFAAALLALLLLVQRKSFRVTAHEAAVLAVLGLLFAVSSITYFVSFHYIAAGVASTIVFMYPVMVALIMALFFHERLTRPMLAAIVLTLGGIGLLYRGDGSGSLSPAGVGLALVSALTYALYIIVVNRSRLVMSGVKLTFYALLVCLAGIALFALCSGEPLQPLPSAHAWFFALLLGLVPTVVSLVTMAVAIRCIGSTPTAVMGALEPVTALAVGTLVFSEPFGASQAAGVGAILLAVTAVVAGRSLRRSPRRGARPARRALCVEALAVALRRLVSYDKACLPRTVAIVRGRHFFATLSSRRGRISACRARRHSWRQGGASFRRGAVRA